MKLCQRTFLRRWCSQFPVVVLQSCMAPENLELSCFLSMRKDCGKISRLGSQVEVPRFRLGRGDKPPTFFCCDSLLHELRFKWQMQTMQLLKLQKSCMQFITLPLLMYAVTALPTGANQSEMTRKDVRGIHLDGAARGRVGGRLPRW